MIKKIRTNEGIQYKKLTPEEMKARGILGRLIGPCADFNNATRNGRKYSEQLWENVFNNPIMQEKIKNGVCFGELGHPEDRTEIDMEKIAVCLREQPVKNDLGQLCAVFDILDTPNGRILKTLCDYGSTVGVSSRGQGDLITDANGDEAVDPDTYECECWDIVLVPAVESARMQYVTEGLNTKAIKMKKALNESLNSASEEERKIMEKTLEELNIKLTEAAKEEEEIKEPESEIIGDDVNSDEVAVEEPVEEIIPEEPLDAEEPVEEPVESELPVEGEEIPAEQPVEETPEEIPEVETELELVEPGEEIGEEETELTDDEKEDIFLDYLTTHFDEKQVKKACKALDIDVEDIEEITEEEPEVEETEEVPEEAAEETEVEEPEVESEENESEPEEGEDIEEEDSKEEPVEESKEAVDNGAMALIESLKEALKGKSDLEGNVKSLQEKLAVSDTKVTELNEECDRYKKAVARLATISKSTKDLKESVSNLEKSNSEKDAIISEQKEIIAKLSESAKNNICESASLNESVSTKTKEVATLNESLTKANSEIAQLKESIKKSEASLTRATSIKESYKNLANKAVNKYIEVKANMLGLTSTDIKRKLGESYTLEDVDAVCESLKSYQLNVSKLPFSIDRKVSVKVNEARSQRPISNKSQDGMEDDDVDDTLIKLANIR